MNATLSVAAIENGTVIDHIPAGEGMRIVRLLKLAGAKTRVTLGLNLPSRLLGYKDLIKVEGREVSEEEANQIAIFAPKATLNIIHAFQLVKKVALHLPEQVEASLACPNARCVTNYEPINTRFFLRKQREGVHITCFYCEKSFAHDTF